MPASYEHYINFKLVTQNGLVALNVSMPASSLSGREVVLAFTGATANDNNLIQSWGGLDSVPPALVNVVPMILVDDNQYKPLYRATQGAVPMSMGDESTLIIDIYTPNGVNEVSTGIVSGSVLALSISFPSPVGRGQSEGFSSTSNPIFTQGMNLLYHSASDQGLNWNSAESEIAGFSGIRVVHPEVSIVAAKPVMNVSTTLGIVTGMRTTGAALDALSRISSAIPISPDTGVPTKGFMYLSGYEGSYLEEKAFEDVLGVESISTMKLLRLAAGQGISIVTINRQNIGTVLITLASQERAGVRSIPGLDPTTSAAIISNIQDLVNQGLEVQIPISGTTYQAFTGTGYIAINLNTGEGGYYLSGNLHGGMTVLALVYWPPDLGLPIVEPNTHVVPPDTDPNAVTQLVKVSPDWAVGTVGHFLEAPLIVRAEDSSGVPVSGATITFNVGDGGGCIAPYIPELSLPEPPPPPVCIGNTVSVMTGYTGEAGVWFQLGKYTNVHPIYYMRPDEQEVTQAGINTLNAVSQNNIGLIGGYTAIGRPGAPTTLTGIDDVNQSAARLASYVGFDVVMITDQYNNPVSNIPIQFNANTQYLGSNGQDPLFLKYYEKLAIFPLQNDGVGSCPTAPAQDDVVACGGGQGPIPILTTYQGAFIGVIFANVFDSIYTVTATAPSTGLPGHSFVYDGSWYQQIHPHTYYSDIYTEVLYYVDTSGHILSAGPVSGTGSFEVNVNEAHSICAWTSTTTCDIGCVDNMWSSPEPITATTTVTTVKGTGTAGTQKELSVGVYTIPLNLGSVPEYEQYQVTAQVGQVPATILGTPPAGCNANPVVNPEYLNPVPSPYYAVAITPVTVGPNPLILNAQSYSTQALNITYAILPFSYTANVAQVDLLSAVPGGAPAWLPVMSFVGDTSGSGTETLNKGSKLDATKDYAVQVVLNRGSGNEIDSEKMPVTVAQFYVEKADPQFPDVHLWDKYYPALGTRNITVHAQAGGVNTSINAELISSPNKVSIEPSTLPSNGKAVFHLDGSGITSGAVPNIPIEFSWDVHGQTITDVITYRVRDTYNTDMASVINGDNVFVYDKHHAGLTPTTVAYGSQRGEMVDRLQIMLNEVVPRKSNVNTDYTLLTEDGIYGDNTMKAINTYKKYFDVGVDMTSSATQHADGTISYGSSDNTSDNFRVLMKWYGLTESSSAYLNEIVDRETLVGWNGYDTNDMRVNNGLSITDTGLYELYANVVKPFTQAMMFSAVAYITASTDNWYARTGEGPAGTANPPGPHGPGMSYCYGCKQTIAQFNATVAKCQAPDTDKIDSWENDGISGNEYRGNLSPSCQVGQGTLRWAGLVDTEINYSSNSPFNPAYWGGVDCSGFVQRTGEYATNIMKAQNTPLFISYWANSACMFFFSYDDCLEQHDIGIPLAITDPTSGYVYIYGHGDTQRTEHVEQKLHRGDLVEYQHHISIIYCTPKDDPTGECAGLADGQYKIIHAYGINYYNDRDLGRIFSRKVLITYQNIARPIGFGRIILWK